MLDLNTVFVGQTVGIAKHGAWQTRSQGLYMVVKANKVKVVVRRLVDDHERLFSVKRGCEVGGNKYNSAFLETVEAQAAREAKKTAQKNVDSAWKDLENAVALRSIQQIEWTLSALKAVQTTPLL